jgi:hypothetical protein
MPVQPAPTITAPILLVTAYGSFMPSEEVARWRRAATGTPVGTQRAVPDPATQLAQRRLRSSTLSNWTPRPAHARVLLVEDNPVNQLVAKGMLTKLGCEVVVAAHGAEALDHWRTTLRSGADGLQHAGDGRL